MNYKELENSNLEKFSFTDSQINFDIIKEQEE